MALPPAAPTGRRGRGYEVGERVLDVAVSAALPIAGPPPPIAIAVGVKPSGPGPILFKRGRRDVGRRLAARPGLGGIWQVSGRSDTPYPGRVAMDLRHITQGLSALYSYILGGCQNVLLFRPA